MYHLLNQLVQALCLITKEKEAGTCFAQTLHLISLSYHHSKGVFYYCII